MTDESNVPSPDEAPVVQAAPLAVVHTRANAQALVLALSGVIPTNQCRFICMNCSWTGTFEFDSDEMAALDGDPRNHRLCIGDKERPDGKGKDGCHRETLMPYDSVEHGAFRSIQDMSSDNKKKDYGDAADVFIDKVQGRLGDIITGGMAGMANASPAAASAVRTDGSVRAEEEADPEIVPRKTS
jgi:hypothetical protein